MNLPRRFAVLLALVISACSPAPPSGGPAPAPASSGRALYTWVQYATGERWSVREIMRADAPCAGGMQVRAEPSRAFPVRVCEARIPLATARVKIGGRTFRRPVADPERIAVLGDTGCRVKLAQVQDCADPRAWPFAQVVASIRRAAPALVVHVGDFYYREMCPPELADCARGGPLGDNWAAWNADFFAAAAPLLARAPWVMLRGNHENCGRGGEGWFRLLDPGERPAGAESYCIPFTEPFAIRLARVDLLLMDSGCAAANTFCTAAQETTDAEYRREMGVVSGLARGRPSWLVTHSPVWTVMPYRGTDSTGTRVLQAAVRALPGEQLPASVDLAIAGHVHLFQALDFAGARPAQLVVGNSGTALDPTLNTPQVGRVLDGGRVAAFTRAPGFGYALLAPYRGAWSVDAHAADGSFLRRCRAGGRHLTCWAPLS